MSEPESAKSVEVDKWLCAGHARCEEIAPEIFRVNDDGLAEVLRQPSSEHDWSDVQSAIEQCPVRAIILVTKGDDSKGLDGD